MVKLRREGVSTVNFAVLAHGFEAHGRDDVFQTQDSAGLYRLTFTHVVQVQYGTRVDDGLWSRSWSDEYLDYDAWLSAGEPAGFVRGTSWSLAYPGIPLPDGSGEPAEWSRRLGRPMYPVVIETERFVIRFIFGGAHIVERSDEASLIRSILIPLGLRGRE